MGVLVLVSKESKQQNQKLIERIKKNITANVLYIEDDVNKVIKRCNASEKIIIISDKNLVEYLGSGLPVYDLNESLFISNLKKLVLITIDDKKRVFYDYIEKSKKCNLNDSNDIEETIKYIKLTMNTKDKRLSDKSYNNILLTIMSIATLLVAVIGTTFAYFGVERIKIGEVPSFAIDSTTMIIIMILLTIIFIFRKRISNLIFEEYYDEYDEKIKTALVKDDIYMEDKEEKINALGRMELNLSDIKEFYVWTKKQSKAAFFLAIFLIIIGIITLVTVIVASIYLKLETSVTIIGAVGSIIIEFIGATSLVVYKVTLSQLNHYHRSLHEDERFLSSVNLINNLSNSTQKDEMIKQVINSELELNLIELKQSEEAKEKNK